MKQQVEKNLQKYYLDEFFKLPTLEQQKIDKSINNKLLSHKLLKKVLLDNKDLYNSRRDRERIVIMQSRVGEIKRSA